MRIDAAFQRAPSKDQHGAAAARASPSPMPHIRHIMPVPLPINDCVY
jgi:hypothetical protein